MAATNFILKLRIKKQQFSQQYNNKLLTVAFCKWSDADMGSRVIINKIEEGEETVSMEIFCQPSDTDQVAENVSLGIQENVSIDKVICYTLWKKGYLKPNKKEVSQLMIDTTTDVNALILNINQCITTMESMDIVANDSDVLMTVEYNQQDISQPTYIVQVIEPSEKKPKSVDELCSTLRENKESNDTEKEQNESWRDAQLNSTMDDTYNHWDYYIEKINKLNKNIEIKAKNLKMLLYVEDYYNLFQFRNSAIDGNASDSEKVAKSNTNYVCEFCQNTLPSLKKLLRHQKVHKTEDGYKCIYCDIKFDLFKKALSHWCNECPGIQKILVASQNAFTCENCHNKCVNAHIMPSLGGKTDTLTHVENDSSEPNKQVFIALMCKNCGYVSTHDQNTTLKNMKETRMLCHVCGKVNNNLRYCKHDEH